MEFYIVIGVITAFLAQKSIRFYDINRFFSYFLLSCFVLLPSIIEGCRDWDLGSDMQGYGSAYFYNAQSYDNIHLFLANLDSKEYAYQLLCYFCGKVGTINFYMFIAAVIKMIMLALTCIYFREKTIVWLFVFCYMMFFYWYGFSLMRQSLALSICMYSLTFFYERKYLGFILCILIAYLFHNSAVFMLFILIIRIMERFEKRAKYAIAGIILCYIFANTLFLLIASSGLFGESKMDLYIDSGVASAKSNILIMSYFFFLPFWGNVDDDDLVYYTQVTSAIGLMFLLLANLFEVAFRVSFYQMILLLIIVPEMIMEIPNSQRKTTLIIITIILFFVHIYISNQHGMADTVPYRSKIIELFL